MLCFVLLILLSNSFLTNFHERLPACPKIGRKADGYSNLSINLCFQDQENERRHLEIPSPDRSILFVIDGQDGKFLDSGHQIGHTITVGRDQEIIWSPDSRALIFTLSLGASGPVGAGIGFVREDLKGPDVTKVLQEDFAIGHPNDACWKEANIGGLGWLEGSAKAIFVAEVTPSPQCQETGGYFDAYVVSARDGRILNRYPMKEAIRRWHKLLGPRLRGDINLLKDR